MRRNLALDASMSRSFAAVRRETGWRGASEGCYQKGLWSGRDHPPSSRRWNDASSPVLPGACLVRALLEEDQAHALNLVLTRLLGSSIVRRPRVSGLSGEGARPRQPRELQHYPRIAPCDAGVPPPTSSPRGNSSHSLDAWWSGTALPPEKNLGHH